MKIDLKEKFLQTLDGTATEISLAQSLANSIASSGISKTPVRYLMIAQELYKNSEVEVTPEEFNLIKQTIENATQVNVLAKGQLLNLLEEAK